VLEAVERGVDVGDVKGKPAASARVDPFGQVIAVRRAVLEQRQDERLGTAFFQLGELSGGIYARNIYTIREQDKTIGCTIRF
jgi:hypothetical protein